MVPVNYGKYGYSKFPQFFFKISFLRVSKVRFRILDSSQIVLRISPNKFCSKIKIQKTMALQSFQTKFQNLTFEMPL